MLPLMHGSVWYASTQVTPSAYLFWEASRSLMLLTVIAYELVLLARIRSTTAADYLMERTWLPLASLALAASLKRGNVGIVRSSMPSPRPASEIRVLGPFGQLICVA